MGALDKRQKLTADRAAMLAALGVQVWYERGPHDPPDQNMLLPEQPRPAEKSHGVQSPPADLEGKHHSPPEVIEFTWIKGRTGMVACAVDADATTLQLVKDFVVFGDWLMTQNQQVDFTPELKAQRATKQGSFRWPQLLDTGGTPRRALAVFVDKHLSEQGNWLALTAEVAPGIAKWLGDMAVTVLELPSLQHNIGDAETKKTVWQSLKRVV